MIVVFLVGMGKKDLNQLAKHIVDIATEDKEPQSEEKAKRAKVSAVRSGAGSKGAASRASKLTPEQRKEIAKKAAAKRWGKSE